MKIFLFIGFFVLFSKPVLAQNGFQLELDFINLHQLAYYANSVPHPAGGIVIIHSPGAFSGDMGVVITYLHSSGEIIWSKNIKTPLHQMIQTEMALTPGGNIIFPIEGGIICLDKKGELVWAKQIKEPSNSGIGGYQSDIHFTSKGEIVSVGNIYNSTATECTGALLRLDANGGLISSKTIKAFCDTRSAITSDDHILITEQNKILKLDLNGNIIWAKEISPSGNTGNTEFIGKVIEDSDGNIVFLNRINNKWILAKLNGSSGEIIWIGDALSAERLEYNDLAVSPGGEYIAVGRMNVTGYTENLKFVSTKFGSNGRYIETRAFENISNRSPRISVAENEVFLVSLGSIVKTEADLKTSCSFPVLVEEDEIEVSVNNATVSVADAGYTVTDSSLNVLESPIDTNIRCCDSLTVAITADTILCLSDTIELKLDGATGNYLWSTGDTTPTIKVHKAGTYWVKVSNVCGEATDTITITEGTAPQPDFTISPTETEPDKFVNFSDNSLNVQQRLWHTGDGFTTDTATFSHSYTQNGIYPARLELTSPDGCIWDTTVFINISYHSWFLPNAFTPNNDDLNEVFEVKGYGILEYRLQVYNRWGEQIFDGSNQGWDGRYKGKRVQPGMYVYTLFLQYDDHRIIHHNGEVYLIE